MRPKTKYHSTKLEVNGMRFDSKKEYKRWLVLKGLEDEGRISHLARQVTYELIPKQVDEDGKCIERSVKYIADFVYYDEGDNLVVEDTKGMRTPDYIIKRKLMLKVHDIRIKEI